MVNKPGRVLTSEGNLCTQTLKSSLASSSKFDAEK